MRQYSVTPCLSPHCEHSTMVTSSLEPIDRIQQVFTMPNASARANARKLASKINENNYIANIYQLYCLVRFVQGLSYRQTRSVIKNPVSCLILLKHFLLLTLRGTKLVLVCLLKNHTICAFFGGKPKNRQRILDITMESDAKTGVIATHEKKTKLN